MAQGSARTSPPTAGNVDHPGYRTAGDSREDAGMLETLLAGFVGGLVGGLTALAVAGSVFAIGVNAAKKRMRRQ